MMVGSTVVFAVMILLAVVAAWVATEVVVEEVADVSIGICLDWV